MPSPLLPALWALSCPGDGAGDAGRRGRLRGGQEKGDAGGCDPRSHPLGR